MAAPSLSKSWYFDVNQLNAAQGSTLATYKKLTFNIKNTLISRGLWTVISSSNSLVANTSDNWSSDANLIWGSSPSVRSWIVLRNVSLSLSFDMLIDLNGAPGMTEVTISPSGFNLNGTTTSPPTPISGSSFTISNSSSIFYYGNFNYSSYLNVLQSQDGHCTRIIIRSGTGINASTSIFCIEKISTSLSAINLYSPVATFSKSYDSSATIQRVLLNNSLTSTVTSTQVPLLKLINEYSGSFSASGLYHSQFMIGKAGLIYYSYPSRGIIGSFQDLWYKQYLSNPSNGIEYVISAPGDGSRAFMQFNNLLFPWNGTSSLSP